MRHAILQDHSNAKRMSTFGWTWVLQLLPCTIGYHSNQGQMLLPYMRLKPLMESLKQEEEI